MSVVRLKSSLLVASTSIACGLTVAACGGGGGGGGTVPTTPIVSSPPPATEPPPAPPPPEEPDFVIPNVETKEFTRNWGLADSNVVSAWEARATGKGVTVAVIDSGIDPDHGDLAANISSLSRDISTERNSLEGADRHGTRVASIIAAPFNSHGTVGVAYESQIMAIRADSDTCKEAACFTSSDLAQSVVYAVNQGAKIINLSLGSDSSLGPSFEAALQKAVDAGVILAISAGNNGAVNPHFPGRYASDPRFRNNIIVVGAHNVNGEMASFSNRAGVSLTNYISAPGEDLVTDCDNSTCWKISGTSFSAPMVAGAMALLKQAFPNLTGPEIVDILLRSARDAGDEGNDMTWGRGKLDLQRAFQPIGATVTPTANGEEAEVEDEPGTFVGPAFGDAFSNTGQLTTIAYDEYNRLFTIELGKSFRAAPRRSFQTSNPKAVQRTRVSTAGPAGSALTFSAAAPAIEPEVILPRYDLYSAPWLGTEERREAMVSIDTPRLSFSAWQGEGGANSPFQTGAGDSFTALAQANSAVRGGMKFHSETLGLFNLTAEAGSGDRRAPLRAVERDAARYGRMGLDWRRGKGGLSFSMGQLDERTGPLGAYLPSNSDLALPANTTFGAIGGDWRLNDNITLVAEGGIGSTRIDGGFMALEDKAISSNWRLQMVANCPKVFWGCRTLSWEVSQPMRIESGTFRATLADVPLDYFDPVTFSVRRFSAAPSGREIDLTVRSVHQFGNGSTLQLQATAIRDEQHVRNAKPGYALVGQWRRSF